MSVEFKMMLLGASLFLFTAFLVQGVYVPLCRKAARSRYTDEIVKELIDEHVCATLGGLGPLGSNAGFVRFSLYPEKLIVTFSQLGRRKRFDVALSDLTEFKRFNLRLLRPCKLVHTSEQFSSPIILLSASRSFEQAVSDALITHQE